jgi:hypothetical protein
MRPDHRQSIEKSVIDQISSGLLFFSCQQNAYKFLRPYCQTGLRTTKGKHYAKGDAKGYLYQRGKAWNFKCHKSNCPTHIQKAGGKSFEKFLADHFPQQHLEYVRRRDELGLTGYQTNCPKLVTLLKKRGVLGNPPEVQPERFHQNVQSALTPPAASSASPAPKVTKLPPMRSPQQQAGCQASLNRQMKQREQRRRERQGW